jgi:hypothetical protein
MHKKRISVDFSGSEPYGSKLLVNAAAAPSPHASAIHSHASAIVWVVGTGERIAHELAQNARKK